MIAKELLLNIKRPARYIGQEWNSSLKDFSDSRLRFVLCFPDLYEVGMSNLGIRIIYGLLNSLPGVVCDRCFAPALDMERLLRDKDIPLFSLENKISLDQFDLVGFSLGHELDYTNILMMLELGRIPLLAVERKRTHPFVLGGGACVLNPEPLHAFFDFFLIGEAEEAILQLTNLYFKIGSKIKSGQISRQEALVEFSQIPGIYVPSLYEVTYKDASIIADFRPKLKGIPTKISKRYVKDFNTSFFPIQWLVPFIPIVHDRISLEIMRGCPNSCNFCQAQKQYFPWRIKEPEKILELAKQAFRATGYEELALTGLSVSDYPGFSELVQRLALQFKEKGVSVSLSSIKPKDITPQLSSCLAQVRKTTLTFAPEAATAKLRSILNKDFNEEELFNTAKEAFASGYLHLKLYFMIGIPAEENTDLDAIVDFTLRISELRRQISGRPAQINVSVSSLIPKPHTPLQWSKMESRQNLFHKQEYLRERVSKLRFLHFSFHNPNMSFLEGVFSRGDRRLSAVLLNAYKRGSRFDAWDDLFNFENWLAAFADSKIDPEEYLQEKPKDAFLSWGFIDVGFSQEELWDQFKKPFAR